MATAMAFPEATNKGGRGKTSILDTEVSKSYITKARYVLRHTPTAEGQPYPQRCLDVMAGLLTLTGAYDLTQMEVKSAFFGTFKGGWAQGTPQPFWRPGEIGSPVKHAFPRSRANIFLPFLPPSEWLVSVGLWFPERVTITGWALDGDELTHCAAPARLGS